MITILFAGFLSLSIVVALTDWRRGWLMAILCGILQDPARKLTPGTPVAMTLSIVLVYAAVLFAGSGIIRRHGVEFTRRLNHKDILEDQWVKAPALSLFIYCAPIPAVLLGYTYLQREEDLYTLFRFYAVATTIALLGTPLEYMSLDWPVLGTVALNDVNLRHLPGIQIRMLSGFYRAPDVMGWHAATLAIIGLIMIVRRQTLRRSWIWMLVTGWAAFNCILSGRRKAVYMIAVFAIVFLWRFFRRLTMPQVVAFLLTIVLVGGVVEKISEDAQSNVYTRGTVTTREEVFERLEGGLVETVRQFGVLGAGLGTATQGVRRGGLVAADALRVVRHRGGEHGRVPRLRAGVLRRGARPDDRVLHRLSLRHRGAGRTVGGCCFGRSGHAGAAEAGNGLAKGRFCASCTSCPPTCRRRATAGRSSPCMGWPGRWRRAATTCTSSPPTLTATEPPTSRWESRFRCTA